VNSAVTVTFRVHRGVIARHSEVFDSMFLVPQPGADMVETMDGCQVVRMWDSPLELSNLIIALYDGAYVQRLNTLDTSNPPPRKFSNERLEDFYYLAGILRLASKYFVTKLRAQAILHLTQTWSYTLKGHDDMVEAALR
jgi:hypothetical protein